MKLSKYSFLLILIAFSSPLSGATKSVEIANPEKSQPESKESSLYREEPKKQQTPFDSQLPHSTTNQNTAANQTTKQESEAQPPNGNSTWWFNLFVVFFTGCLVCVGIAQVVVYRRQARYMRHGLRLTREAAEAAKQSADVARQQVEIMASSERPWMMMEVVDKWDSPTVHQPQHGFGGVVEWSAINVGKSPAFLTHLVVVVDTVPYPIVDQRPDYPTPHTFAKFIIPPNGKHSSKTPKPIDAAVMGKIFDGTWCQIFYGFIDYRDSLGETHQTRFCSYWHMRTILLEENIIDKRDWHFEPVGPPSYTEYT